MPMPDAVRNLLAVFEVLNISIAGVGLPLQCLSLGTYEQQLFFTMLAPLVLAAALVLVFVLRSCFGKRGGPKAGLLAALPSLLTISFLVFPVVSSAVRCDVKPNSAFAGRAPRLSCALALCCAGFPRLPVRSF